ncbi:transposase family protein [Streptomyces sp. NPDC006711]|uniref:transposase family protein n=1 Tax=Streptomyces sp. NPDC006711 TaxID=3364762 RepID=UPI00367B42D9
MVVLRFQLPHAALAVLYGVDRSTITRAVHEIRPLLAARSFAVSAYAGLRLRTLEDVFACAAAEEVELRLDGTEARVRRPKANRPGRRAFVSGRMGRTPRRPLWSPTGGAAPCGRGRSGPAGCATRRP